MQPTSYAFFWLLVLGAALLAPRRRLPYLHSAVVPPAQPGAVKNTRPFYVGQRNDALSIRVRRGPAELRELCNIGGARAMRGSNLGTMFWGGCSVLAEGERALPTVGKLQVAGLLVAALGPQRVH